MHPPISDQKQVAQTRELLPAIRTHSLDLSGWTRILLQVLLRTPLVFFRNPLPLTQDQRMSEPSPPRIPPVSVRQ